jgi:hypothetical protein
MRHDHTSAHREWTHDEPRNGRFQCLALWGLVAILLALAGWSLYSAVV